MNTDYAYIIHNEVEVVHDTIELVAEKMLKQKVLYIPPVQYIYRGVGKTF